MAPQAAVQFANTRRDGAIMVKVVEATDLLPADDNGLSDPYVALHLGGSNPVSVHPPHTHFSPGTHGPEFIQNKHSGIPIRCRRSQRTGHLTATV